MKTKVTRKVTTDIEITTVEIDIPLDEITDHTPALPTTLIAHFKRDDSWSIRVAIDTGRIEAWPADVGAIDLYCKPRDGGSYRLIGPGGSAGEEVVAAIEQNYVPNGLVPGDYGDYVGLKIAADGRITNWPPPPEIDLRAFFSDDQ